MECESQVQKKMLYDVVVVVCFGKKGQCLLKDNSLIMAKGDKYFVFLWESKKM